MKNKRINLYNLEPEGYRAMLQLETYIQSAQLEATLKELIKIKASQINGCGFCIQMHAKKALEAGETKERIFALNAWRISPLFTEKEKAVLAVTEEVTLIAQNGLSETVYREASRFFTENELAQIIMQICIINSWNRIAVATLME